MNLFINNKCRKIINDNIIMLLKNILYVLVVPLLFFATYWEVKKRVFTNVYLTMTKLGKVEHIENIRTIVMKNLLLLIRDRLRFLLLLLPFWLLKCLIMKYAILIGIEKLDTLLNRGKGAVVFSCHIGPYYFTPAALALLGYKVIILERFGFIEVPIVNYHIKKINKLKGSTVLETTTIYDDLLLRKLKKCLQEGKIVYIMGDYHGFNYKGSYVKFLGYDIIPGRGIAWLHKKTGAPLVPIVVEYSDTNKGNIKIYNELIVDRQQDIDSITQDVYHTLEDFILQKPERWLLWMDYHLILSPEARGN